MVHMIRNYRMGYRLTIIDKGDLCCSVDEQFERLYIYGNKIKFRSDHQEMIVDDKIAEFLNSLHTGDVMSINERGLCYVLFNQTQGDTVFFMGGKCNSNCTMCPAPDSERKRDYSGQGQEVLKLINMMPDHINYFVVTGGEPTLNPFDFLKVMDAITHKFINAQGVVLTNGRSFSSEQLADAFVAVAPRNTIVAIPIHGSVPEIHDEITRAKGSLGQSIRGIRNLIARKVYVEIRIVVTKMNCDDLLNIAKLIYKFFPTAYRIHFISLEVRGNCIRNKELVYISPEDSFKKSKEAVEYLLQHGMNVGLYNYPLCNVDRKYWFIYKKSIASEKATFSDECDGCDMKAYCGGLFVSTLKTVHPNVYPITISKGIEEK